ncbi:hypothetical protein QJQ45_027383 [Haematococcus lacustris]|nr:hypothetical protein QJQ45_027383 [Haematococcus lacustris]
MTGAALFFQHIRPNMAETQVLAWLIRIKEAEGLLESRTKELTQQRDERAQLEYKLKQERSAENFLRQELLQHQGQLASAKRACLAAANAAGKLQESLDNGNDLAFFEEACSDPSNGGPVAVEQAALARCQQLQAHISEVHTRMPMLKARLNTAALEAKEAHLKVTSQLEAKAAEATARLHIQQQAEERQRLLAALDAAKCDRDKLCHQQEDMELRGPILIYGTCSGFEQAQPVIDGRLFFCPLRRSVESLRSSNLAATSICYCIDDQLVSPLHEAVATTCLLQEADRSKKRLYYYCGPHAQQRSNAAVLIGIYQVVFLNRTAEEAYRPLQAFKPYMPFRDASCGVSTFHLTVWDVIKGIQKARDVSFIDWSVDSTTWNCEEYEHYEQVENGDLNWIVPGKLVAFSGPAARGNEIAGYRLHTPEDYWDYWRKKGVTAIVRLNKKVYDRKRFTDGGFRHYDLYFPDGSCPSEAILLKFLEIAESEPGALAIHCKAGLGRTGVLICCYCMKHFRFTVEEVIGYIRVCRPGSVIGPQQNFLRDVEARMWHEGDVYRAQRGITKPHLTLGDLVINGRPAVGPATPMTQQPSSSANSASSTVTAFAAYSQGSVLPQVSDGSVTSHQLATPSSLKPGFNSASSSPTGSTASYGGSQSTGYSPGAAGSQSPLPSGASQQGTAGQASQLTAQGSGGLSSIGPPSPSAQRPDLAPSLAAASAPSGAAYVSSLSTDLSLQQYGGKAVQPGVAGQGAALPLATADSYSQGLTNLQGLRGTALNVQVPRYNSSAGSSAAGTPTSQGSSPGAGGSGTGAGPRPLSNTSSNSRLSGVGGQGAGPGIYQGRSITPLRYTASASSAMPHPGLAHLGSLGHTNQSFSQPNLAGLQSVGPTSFNSASNATASVAAAAAASASRPGSQLNSSPVSRSLAERGGGGGGGISGSALYGRAPSADRAAAQDRDSSRGLGSMGLGSGGILGGNAASLRATLHTDTLRAMDRQGSRGVGGLGGLPDRATQSLDNLGQAAGGGLLAGMYSGGATGSAMSSWRGGQGAGLGIGGGGGAAAAGGAGERGYGSASQSNQYAPIPTTPKSTPGQRPGAGVARTLAPNGQPRKIPMAMLPTYHAGMASRAAAYANGACATGPSNSNQLASSGTAGAAGVAATETRGGRGRLDGAGVAVVGVGAALGTGNAGGVRGSSQRGALVGRAAGVK